MAASTRVFEKTDEKPDTPTFSHKSSRPPVLSAPRKASGLTGIQQAAGNLGMQRWLRSGGSGAILPKLKVNPPNDAYEQEADHIAERVASGRESGPMQTNSMGASAGSEESLQRKPRGTATAPGEGGPATGRTTDSQRDGLPSDSGRPLSAATRRLVEPAFGTDFGDVRLHDSQTAQLTAGSLGARAFTHGNHIWLGPGARETDHSLMAHELAHVLQHGDGLYLRRATWLERRAWLSLFDHYLPRKFLNNYMDDTGNPVTLTWQEMIDVNPRVAAMGLPGQPFYINSMDAPVSQTGTDPRAVWAGGTPKFVNDRAGRAGADIGVGDVGGGAAGSTVGQWKNCSASHCPRRLPIYATVYGARAPTLPSMMRISHSGCPTQPTSTLSGAES